MPIQQKLLWFSLSCDACGKTHQVNFDLKQVRVPEEADILLAYPDWHVRYKPQKEVFCLCPECKRKWDIMEKEMRGFDEK